MPCARPQPEASRPRASSTSRSPPTPSPSRSRSRRRRQTSTSRPIPTLLTRCRTRPTNFSSQNQVLAQEKPQLDQHNDKPKLEGKKDINSNQTVSGQLTKPQESAPPVPSVTPSGQRPRRRPSRRRIPSAGFDKDGRRRWLRQQRGQGPRRVQARGHQGGGRKERPARRRRQTSQPAIDPEEAPCAAVELETIQTRPAIFKDNDFGTSNMGPVAYSAKWSSLRRLPAQDDRGDPDPVG
jgi:hypothetical protein